jgi:hypothetical protein
MKLPAAAYSAEAVVWAAKAGSYRGIRRKRIKSWESIVDSPFCVEEQHPSRRYISLHYPVMNLTASRKHDILTSLFGILVRPVKNTSPVHCSRDVANETRT